MFNDPTGHCFTGFVVDTMVCFDIIIIVGVVVAGTTLMAATPQGQELRNQAVEGIMQMGKSGEPSTKNRKAQNNLNQMNFQADDLEYRGPVLKNLFDPCKKDLATCAALLVGTAMAVTTGLYNALKCAEEVGESCNEIKTSNLVVPSKTPTATPTFSMGNPSRVFPFYTPFGPETHALETPKTLISTPTAPPSTRLPAYPILNNQRMFIPQ